MVTIYDREKNAERQKAQRDRERARGIIWRTVKIPAEREAELKAIVNAWRDGERVEVMVWTDYPKKEASK